MPESVESSPMNEGILTWSHFRNKTLANQAIFLFSISTTFITPPNYYMWVHVIAFLVIIREGGVRLKKKKKKKKKKKDRIQFWPKNISRAE